MTMTPRPKHLPPVEGFDEEEALAESSPDAMLDSMGNPFEKLAGRPPPPQPGEEDPIGPAIGGMKALGPADKGDLDSAITGTLAKQPPPPPPGSQMPSGGAPPSMPAGMSRHYDDEQSDKRDVQSGRERDDQNRMMRGLEMAGRQLVGGVLQQPVAESVGQQTNYEQEATARAQRNRETRRTGDIDERNYSVADGQRKIALAHQGFMERGDVAEAERKASLDVVKKKKDESDADFKERQLKSQEKRSSNHNASIEKAAAIAAGKVDYDRAEGLPYGYELLPGAKPSKKQREDVEGLTTNTEAMNSNIDALDNIIKNTPKTALLNPGSNEHQRMGQLIGEIGANVRVSEGLGVPSGPDTKITKDLQGDPDNAFNIIMGRGGSAMAEMRRYSQNKVSAKLHNLGIKKSTSPGGGPEKKGDMVTVVRKSDGVTAVMSRKDAAEVGPDYEVR